MVARNPIIVGNWKMNNTVKDSIRLITGLRAAMSGKQEVEVVVGPNSVALHPVCIALQDSDVAVAAQNMHWEEQGAFTGEVSAPMLEDVGCTYVILGHSERRHKFGETDAEIHLKVKAALEHDLVPIVCVGEVLDQREAGETLKVIERQLNEIFGKITLMDGSDLLVAYEPVWAIGTGKTATPEQAQEVHQFIRQHLAVLFREPIANQLRILYGGSVTPENATELMRMADLDGLLVGGASLDAESFTAIVGYQDDSEELD